MNAATWIDRRLADGQAEPARDTGFGHDVREAEARRRQCLVEQDHAVERGGKVRVATNALEQLRRRELLRIADRLFNELGREYVEASVGERIEGVVRRPVEMVSGRYVPIERAHDFTLVPWKPTLERQIGKPVSGIVREAGISWTVGRERGGPSIS